MYKVGEHIVYKKDVCIIKDIKISDFNNKEYYILSPIDDESLTIEIPCDNNLGNIRKIISKSKAKKIIEEIPNIKELDFDNDKLLEQEYKRILYNGDYEELIQIIKTTHMRNQNRIDNKRKIGEKDDAYFKKAERILYNEFSIAFGFSFDEMKEYVVNIVNNLTK